MSTRRTHLDRGVIRHDPLLKVSGGPREPDWPHVAQMVLGKASDLGFIRAGVALLGALDEPVRRLEAFLDQGRHGVMEYLAQRQPDGQLTRSDPRYLMPGALSAVVVALPYPLDPRTTGAPPHAETARYARGTDYHQVLKEKLLQLADNVATLVGSTITARACVDSAPLLERDLALLAGFAFLGKNTLAIAPGAGSHFLLGELLLDVPLPAATSFVLQGCGSCRACLDACPTQAFVKPFELDATKCISYLTIESSEDVPHELRGQIGSHLFGCDICQTVCPFNAAGAQRPSAPELTPRKEFEQLKPEAVLSLGSSAHKKLVQGTALRRASRNQLARNAAIVMGNRGRASDVALLAQYARSHISAQVRRHCVWALASLLHRHGVHEALPLLEALCNSEDEAVAAEARMSMDSETFEKASRPHPAPDAHGN